MVSVVFVWAAAEGLAAGTTVQTVAETCGTSELSTNKITTLWQLFVLTMVIHIPE
jgi:hypothetical protein